MPIAAGIIKSPKLNGKNQDPNPFVIPILVRYVKSIIREKIIKTDNFRKRNIRVATMYAFGHYPQ